MSRTAARSSTVARRPGEDDDICPVCKSSRYLNPDMRFKVNPVCYHKMCESCVDRIFSQGPAPCPVAGCGQTLRKARFRAQTFEDIQVEKEVDVRREVAKTFNRRQDEFESLEDYNNYLEEVETITFNLLYKIDLDATRAKLDAYASQNADVITKNNRLQQAESAHLEARKKAEKEEAKLRRELARREEEEEKQAREEGRKVVLNELAHGTRNVNEVIKEQKKIELLKRGKARQAAEQARQTASMTGDRFVIRGLKKDAEPEIEKPYDPFGGLDYKKEYYVLQDHYENSWLDKARTDPTMTAGGYAVSEYYARTMLEAFSGLGVFVEDEVAQTEPGPVATEAAAAAAVVPDDDAKMLDAS